MRRRRAVVMVIAAILLLTGCASYQTVRSAQHAEQTGNWDEAVSLYLDLLAKEPENLEYRTGLLRSKLHASRGHFAEARRLREAGRLEAALRSFQLAVHLDPTNDFAQAEMRNTLEELADRRAREGGQPTLDELKKQAEVARQQPPMLSPRSDEPIDLNFPTPVPVRDIYQALGAAFGINILFDQALENKSLSLELQEVRSQDALEMVMRAAGHFYKVLDEHTILVADDNPRNRALYEDLLIQTFYLSNADPRELSTVLRTLVGHRHVAPNQDLNAIVLRDSADKVRVAERIIRANDKSRGEVVVDVELIQIDANRMQNLGMQLGSYSLSQSFDENAQPVRLTELSRIGERASWIVAVPNVVYNFLKESSDVRFLAQPQLRISDGETARLHIGDQVPVPVTTFQTGQTIGGNIVPITSFQYRDVGIRIDLEPRIHHNEEITLKLQVEVSNISGSVTGTGGQTQPIISTRTIESTIRLMSGETNMLAGLIQSRESRDTQGPVGLSSIPLLGRLFSHDGTDRSHTDLILTLTPHIIRTADITPEDLQPIWVGTEQNITFRGGSPRLESDAEGPFDQPARTPEEIREMIRERLREAREGRTDDEIEEPEEFDDPGFEEIPPGAAPRDIFQRPTPEEEPPDEPEPVPLDSMELVQPEWMSNTAPGESPDSVAGEPVAAGAETIGGGDTEGTATSRAEERPAKSREALQPVWASRSQGRAAASRPRAGERPRDGEGDAAPREGVRFTLAAAKPEVAAGETLEVQVRVSAGSPIAHLPMTLEYDAAKLEILAVERGDFFGGENESVLLSDPSDRGRLVLGVSRLGNRQGVTGTGVVARIRFRALEAGSAKVAFHHAEARDEQVEPVGPVTKSELKVQVRAVAGPEPRERPSPRTRESQPEA